MQALGTANELGMQNRKLIRRLQEMRRRSFDPRLSRSERDELNTQIRKRAAKTIDLMEKQDWLERARRNKERRDRNDRARIGLPLE